MGARVPPGWIKKWGGNLQGKVVSTHRHSKKSYLGNWRYGRCPGVVNLVVFACVLRATTKKVVSFLGEEKCTPEKIPATPVPVTLLS